MSVLLGDAMHLPLGDASVDAIVCDPPYEKQTYTNPDPTQMGLFGESNGRREG